jgi:hypothetical protein
LDEGQSASVGLGDIDRDGDLDVIVIKGNHEQVPDVILVNDGKGRFTKRSLSVTGDRGYGIGIADFDADGDLDLAVGNDRPDPKLLYFNDGRGQFTQAGAFGDPAWPTRNIAVADLNGDRRPDIVVANRDGRSGTHVNYFCINEAGRFGRACREVSPESATTIAVEDMNADGAPDIIVPNRDNRPSYIHLNDGKGGFEQRVSFGSGKDESRGVATGDFNANRLFAVADLDRDGDLDIVVGHASTPQMLLINAGNGRFTVQRLESALGEGSYGVAVGDLNGDGRPDIVSAGLPTQLFLQTAR